MNCWLNMYKPRGISSARLVAIVKRHLKGAKVGHCGTLDLEAEGVLPLAIGEATKLVQFLMSARKEYFFTIKFGAKTDTADFAGQVIQTTDVIPAQQDCVVVCDKFLGIQEQVPPAFSALKVAGKRAYDLARQNKPVELAPRKIEIFKLQCVSYSYKDDSATASYVVECSKGTYVRSLAEDIALSLQSLGFVLELRRSKVGRFCEGDVISLESLEHLSPEEALAFLEQNSMKIETVLDDIPVLEATFQQAQKIRYGQRCYFTAEDCALLWVRCGGNILAIGALQDGCFTSSRVFNI